MSRRYFTPLLPFLLLVTGFALPPQQTPEKAAQEAAESWLRLIDAGMYAESWDELAEVAKAKVPKESWEKLQNDYVGPSNAGEGKARELTLSKSLNPLISTDDRAGFLLRYSMRLDKHRAVEETLELLHEPGRGWRVAFYMRTATTLLFDPSLRAGARGTQAAESAEARLLDVPVDHPQGGTGYGPGSGYGSGSGSGVGSGGMATAVDQRPVALNFPHPQYTREARDNKVQGTVTLRVLVGDDGTVKQVKVVRGLPYGLSDEAVRLAFEVRFKPAMKAGKPVPFWQTMSIEFNLR
ncbi:MAG TPA: TonB family protein [Blastocatellia bacterium]|nr:TonB family protein [Blastocatellia bacterium]